jgi:hypothetical protein
VPIGVFSLTGDPLGNDGPPLDVRAAGEGRGVGPRVCGRVHRGRRRRRTGAQEVAGDGGADLLGLTRFVLTLFL